jgi:hypothetical protein
MLGEYVKTSALENFVEAVNSSIGVKKAELPEDWDGSVALSSK